MTGKDALGIINSLANFVSAAYNIHLAIVTAVVGLIAAAFDLPGFVLDTGAKIAIGVFYGFVALSTLVTLHFLYEKINALNKLAEILLTEEFKKHQAINRYDDLTELTPVITKPVTGYIHRFIFPVIIVLVFIGIYFAPNELQEKSDKAEGAAKVTASDQTVGVLQSTGTALQIRS